MQKCLLSHKELQDEEVMQVTCILLIPEIEEFLDIRKPTGGMSIVSVQILHHGVCYKMINLWKLYTVQHRTKL